MKRKSTVILLFLSWIVILYCFYMPARIMSLRNEFKEQIFPYEPHAVVSLIKGEIIANGYESQTELVDNIRFYINRNSIHKEGTEYHVDIALKLDKRFIVLNDIYKHSKGNNFIPELSCTPRTWAMQEVLRSFDIPFRIINIYFTERPVGKVTSHTFLEYFNSDKEKWEIQDPDGNIYYTDVAGNRLSSLDIMSTPDRNLIKACSNENDCIKHNYWLTFDQSFKAIGIRYLGVFYGKKDQLIIDDNYFNLEETLNDRKFIDHFDNFDVLVF